MITLLSANGAITALVFNMMSGRTLPQESYVFAWNFLQLIERGSLSCKAVVRVVIRHDGGGADLAEFVLWTVQASPHCMQVVLPAVPH